MSAARRPPVGSGRQRTPTSWLVTSPKPGCFSLEPEAGTVPGFWERFFEEEPEAVASFAEERARIVADDP